MAEGLPAPDLRGVRPLHREEVTSASRPTGQAEVLGAGASSVNSPVDEAVEVVVDGIRLTEHFLPCPECGARMALRKDHFGIRYLCVPGCRGAHGAHPDGKPLGIPATASVRRARSNAHETFDRVWRDGPLTRTQAYAWMERVLELGRGEGHISMFDAGMCRRLEDACVRDFPDLFPLRAGL